MLVGVANVPPPVLDQATTCPGAATGFPLASASCARMVTEPPAVTLTALALTRYCVGAPAVAVIGPDVPLIDAPADAVTTCVVPAVPLVVNATDATPFASVVLVGDANDPPFVLDHVTVWPGIAIAFPNASASCAVTVKVPPAATLATVDETSSFARAPAVVVIGGELPLTVPVSAVITCVVPETVPVVNVTLAMPLALVLLDGVAKEPPAPVLDHVTTSPARATGTPLPSRSCALIVTDDPAATLLALDVTTYRPPGTLLDAANPTLLLFPSNVAV